MGSTDYRLAQFSSTTINFAISDTIIKPSTLPKRLRRKRIQHTKQPGGTTGVLKQLVYFSWQIRNEFLHKDKDEHTRINLRKRGLQTGRDGYMVQTSCSAVAIFC